MRAPALLVVLAGLAAVAPGASGSWSAPQDLATPSDYATPAGIAVAPDGGARLAWATRTEPAGAGGLPGAVSVEASAQDNDGETGHTGLLLADGTARAIAASRRTVAAGPVALPDGRTLMLTTQVLGGDDDGSRFVRLRLESADATGHRLPSRTLAARARLSDTALADDARGNVVAAWAQVTPETDERGPYAFQDAYHLRAVSVGATGRLGRTRRLERTTPMRPTTAGSSRPPWAPTDGR